MDPDQAIHLQTSSKTHKPDRKRYRFLCHAILQTLGLEDHDLAIQFVDPEKIRALNLEYRGKDKATDVLSFPQKNWARPIAPQKKVNKSVSAPGPAEFFDSPVERPELLGDLVLCPSIAEKQAQEIGHSLDREVAFLTVHGILHLCGHDHQESKEEQVMLAAQKVIIDVLAKPIGRSTEPLWHGCISSTLSKRSHV